METAALYVPALIAILLACVGVMGVVVPVLPGSLSLAAGLLVWAVFGHSSWGWVAFGVGLLFVLAGMAAQYVLTGRALKRKQIPSRSVVVGLVCGVVGLFVLPFLGLPIGFAVGLLASEYARVRNLKTALGTSGTALRSVGLGMLVELVCALIAASVLAGSILGAFLS